MDRFDISDTGFMTCTQPSHTGYDPQLFSHPPGGLTMRYSLKRTYTDVQDAAQAVFSVLLDFNGHQHLSLWFRSAL